LQEIRGGHFQFGLVFINKKKNQIEIFFKKTETGSNRPVSVRFFRTKTGLARFFWFGSVFFRFFFGSGSIRFGFFSFRLVKPKPNRSIFFKILIGLISFFSLFGFFSYFFSSFFNLISFYFFADPLRETINCPLFFSNLHC